PGDKTHINMWLGLSVFAFSMVSLLSPQTVSDLKVSIILSSLAVLMWLTHRHNGFLAPYVKSILLLTMISLGTQWLPGKLLRLPPTYFYDADPAGFKWP